MADYFEMQNQQSENDSDADLGSGGALVLPDLTDGSGNCGIWPSAREKTATSTWSTGTRWANSTPAATISIRT